MHTNTADHSLNSLSWLTPFDLGSLFMMAVALSEIRVILFKRQAEPLFFACLFYAILLCLSLLLFFRIHDWKQNLFIPLHRLSRVVIQSSRLMSHSWVYFLWNPFIDFHICLLPSGFSIRAVFNCWIDRFSWFTPSAIFSCLIFALAFIKQAAKLHSTCLSSTNLSFLLVVSRVCYSHSHDRSNTSQHTIRVSMITIRTI